MSSAVNTIFENLPDESKNDWAQSHDQYGYLKDSDNDDESCGSFWACNFCNAEGQKYGCPFNIDHKTLFPESN